MSFDRLEIADMPDCVAGATTVMFADLSKAYMIIYRKSVTMLQDGITSFSVTFRFEARIGGGVLCPTAAHLLRIR